MKFPPAFLERLRTALPVSAVVGKRVPLRKHGREFQGVCPFHKEKTPSFTVNDEKGFYHCFGCGAHGDVVQFIMQYERLDYPRAVELLARDAGIAMPRMEPGAEAQEKRLKRLYDVNEAAAQWFAAQYQAQAGAAARCYIESRGVAADTVAAFRIGYAPDQREGLMKTLLAQGFDVALQHTAGLLSKSDDGRYYDRFRGRVMFPICDDRGRVIAFGGRILGDGKPKYLNSAETPLFHKSGRLYAFHQARKTIADQGRSVLVEGYMDVIALHQAGITGAVAPMGTAITPEQLGKLWATGAEVVVCLDGDAAGVRAALKTADTALPLLKAGYMLSMVQLPAGQDPDDVIRSGGVEAIHRLLSAPTALADVLWLRESRRLHPINPERKAACEKALLELTERIQDGVVKRHYQSFFRDKLWQASQTARRGQGAARQPVKPAVKTALAAPGGDVTDTLLATLLYLVIRQPELLDDAEVESGWHGLLPHDAAGLALYEAITLWHGGQEASLPEWLARRGLAEASARIARKVDPLGHLSAEPDVLRSMWADTLRAYQAHILSAESAQALNDDMSEDAWQKLVALRQGDV